MRQKPVSSRAMALGGIMAALAVAVMAMGTIIPVATYVCPAICMILLQIVLISCGKKVAWAWYGAVSILSILFAPDKEAALIYVFLGNYPILKSWMDSKKGKWLLKVSYFNILILTAYYLMMNLLGLEQVMSDLSGANVFIVSVLLLLGNITFLLMDRLLGMGIHRLFKR